MTRRRTAISPSSACSRRCVGLVLVAVLALGACGDGEDSGSAAGRKKDPFTEVSKQPNPTQSARRAAPRWEPVGTFDGTAGESLPIEIHPRAIQWRARWRCSSGRLALTVAPDPRADAERSGGRCPGTGEATWVQTGKQRLRVDGGGRWSVVVEQQVDTPLHEPVLPAIRASGTRLLRSGSFYPVERKGSGRARLYRLADGRGALRLEPFRTSSNTDLYVWLSTAPRPKTTKQVVAARRLGRLIPLKSTIGEQNYLLPRDVDPRRVRSIVIWCVPIQIVYTAAGLS